MPSTKRLWPSEDVDICGSHRVCPAVWYPISRGLITILPAAPSPQLECRESDLMILGFAKHAKPTPDELKKAYKVPSSEQDHDSPNERPKICKWF